MSISPELQLKRISSLHRLKFGGPNNFTVSGNPISVSFPFLCHLAQIFFVNIFEQNFMLTKRITVLRDLPMAYFSIRFMKLNVYFAQNILQLPLFHTRWETIDNYIISMAILVHFIPSYMVTFKLDLKCFKATQD